MSRKAVLTIAGSDPSGGAGIEADTRVFEALGLHPLSAITVLTIQDSSGVYGAMPVPSDHLHRTLEVLFRDFPIGGVKIGALGGADGVEAVAEILDRFGPEKVILDPVLRASSGFRFLDRKGTVRLKERLLRKALLITPNLEEASVLTGLEVKDLKGMERAAEELIRLGAQNVLIKGGHLDGPPVDLLSMDGEVFTMEGERIEGSFHGTGCTLSSAITAYLARGLPLKEAVDRGRRFLARAMEQAVRIGHGRPYLSIPREG